MKFLLNVGAEKAGTTWLHEYFKTHPEFHSIGKELNVLQRDDLVPTHAPNNNFKTNIESYFNFVSKLNKVTGDFTHYEGSTENVYRLIKDGLQKYDIDIVPVYIMRDPIARAWSAWNMLGGSRNINMPPPASFIVENYLQCKYKETVQALDSVFSKPLYFFYESFFKQEDLDKICDNLDISNKQIDLGIINVGTYIESPTDEFINKFCKTTKTLDAVKFIERRFPNVPWTLKDYT